MAKDVFRPWDVEQGDLFPASFKDLVPAGHLAHFIRRVVTEDLDLSGIYAHYSSTKGQPPYHPGLMTALLLYSYCRGTYTSRRIELSCEERLDVRALVGAERPDHSTIAEFRKLHRDALAELFVQVLALCREAGLAKLGHVALDGTKMRANASKHAAMSCRAGIRSSAGAETSTANHESPYEGLRAELATRSSRILARASMRTT